MPILFLLRHGKSSWDNPRLHDSERPLAKRGEQASRRMGAFMAERQYRPDLVLCSTAKRTRQTLELLLPALASAPPVQYEDALYLASSRALLARLRQVRRAERVLVVGHDPGLHELALELAAAGDPAELNALAAKFPTCALAVFALSRRDWAGLEPEEGRLVCFMTPKRLP